MTADPLAALDPMVEKLRAEQPDEPGNEVPYRPHSLDHAAALGQVALWKVHAERWENVARMTAAMLSNTIDHLSERPLTSEERDALRSTFREICEANGVTP